MTSSHFFGLKSVSLSPVLLKAIDPKVNQDEITLDQNQKNCNHREGETRGLRKERMPEEDEEGNKNCKNERSY